MTSTFSSKIDGFWMVCFLKAWFLFIFMSVLFHVAPFVAATLFNRMRQREVFCQLLQKGFAAQTAIAIAWHNPSTVGLVYSSLENIYSIASRAYGIKKQPKRHYYLPQPPQPPPEHVTDSNAYTNRICADRRRSRWALIRMLASWQCNSVNPITPPT